MALTISQTLNVMKDVNVEAAKYAAKTQIGGLLNDRLVQLAKPRLPIMARGFADTEYGKAVLANLFAGAVVHFAPGNEKATLAAEAMTFAAMQDVAVDLDIRGLINEFLDGIDLSELKSAAQNQNQGGE